VTAVFRGTQPARTTSSSKRAIAGCFRRRLARLGIAQRNLLYSADAGAHWAAKELAFASAGNLRVHGLDDSDLLITSNSGLYVSRDAGREWTRADIRDLQFQDAAGYGNALVVSLQRHGLLASFDARKVLAAREKPAGRRLLSGRAHTARWRGGRRFRYRRPTGL